MRPPGRRPARLPCLLALLAVLARAAAAAAAPDLRDVTFAGTGTLVLDLGGDDAADAVALDASGRIVVVATTRAGGHDQVAVVALAPDGAPDASFGARGTARLDAPGHGANVAALAPADSGTVVAGWTGGDAAQPLVLRVTADGAFDADFARRARAALGARQGARALAVASSPGGAILVGGAAPADGGERPFVARLLSDGRRDPSFGDADPVLADRDAAVLAVASDASGRVVVAGRAGPEGFVARLTPDGRLDRTFAHDGIAGVALGRNARVVAVALASDGGAVFVARAGSPSAPALVARTRPDGARDGGFAANGVAELVLDGGALQPRSVAVDAATGRIVVAGTIAGHDGDRTLLVRLLPSGARDPSFGTEGVLDGVATRADVATAVAVQPDGRVVAAGSLGRGAARDVAVARFGDGAGRCGDGTLAPGEQCDDGAANGGTGSCCSASCAPRAAGEACRPADGACDEAELCDGASARCPEDALARAGAPCRAAADACDVAEACSGTSRECPANDVRARGTVCRVARGACDLDEECDGASGECPADGKRTGECRASRGGCDPAEWCDGTSGDCPADALLPDGAACDDGDACTADDVCVASSCRGGPRDDFACAGYVCSRMRSKRRVSGEPPRAADMRAFGLDVQVDGARALCMPAVTAVGGAPAATPRAEDVLAADAADDRRAYVAYKVTPVVPRRARERERAPRLVSATVEDRFGTLVLAPRNVRLVSLPASVDATEAGVAPAGPAYQCQQIAPADVAAPGAREVAVRVLGEAPSERYSVGRPLRVCHPVDTGAVGADASGPGGDDASVCYELRRLGVEAAATRAPLLAVNSFESLLVGALGERQLCVPALLVRAEWDDPEPRRRQRRDPEARKPHRPRHPERAPRPHREQRPPRAAEDPAEP